MKYLSLLLFSSLAIAGTSPKAPEPAPEPQPLQVMGPGRLLATIDPKTLKITYQQGADPKAVATEMVKAWAQVQANLEACVKQVQEKTAEKKK